MLRGFGLAAFVVVTCAAGNDLGGRFETTSEVVSAGVASRQELGRLHVRVAIADAAGRTAPLARHALLVSDLPPSAPPRRIATGPDGTIEMTLPPGRYLVESDRSTVIDGQPYSWAEAVDVPAGGRATLELNERNARPDSRAAPAPAATDAAPSSSDDDPSALLMRWADRVPAVWTPTAHVSGLILDRRGLVATSQHAVDTAAQVDVQITPSLKVAGRVLAADRRSQVALVRIAPSALASAPPSPAPCEAPAARAFAVGQDVLAIGLPLRRPADVAAGTVRSVARDAVLADLRLAPASEGGPVFSSDRRLIGLSTAVDSADERFADTVRIIPIDEVCAAARALESRLAEPAPDPTPLPLVPARPFPEEALAELAAKRAGRIPPTARSAGFDIAFITPVDVYAAAHQPSSRLLDFSNWSDYLADPMPVLLVRATPRQVESFWVTLARGAAWTQGTRLPPITHFKAGFAQLRAFCGATEVTPIHSLKLELRLSESEGTWEGLSVLDPGALGPHCNQVRLDLYSEETPGKADTILVDSDVIERVWQDYEAYRALSAP